MQRPIQFNLRTLGLLLFCFSVGLAANTSGASGLSWLDFLEAAPGILHGTLLITGAIAMVIGLVQQVVYIVRDGVKTVTNRSAIIFAVGWRIVAAILLFAAVMLMIGLNQDWIHLPENQHGRFFFYDRIVPEYLLYSCMIVVFFDILGPRPRFKVRKKSKSLLWVAFSVGAIVVLAQAMQVTFLTYKALAGIEAKLAAGSQRPGAYPDYKAEGNWLFWLSFGAIIFSLVGSYLLLSVVRRAEKCRTRQILAAGIGIALSGMSGIFGYWFVFVGFPEMSPDFAEGGWASSWWECIETGLILAIFIPAFAYRLIAESSPVVEVGERSRPILAFHQSLLVSIMLAMGAFFHAVVWIQNFVDFYAWVPNATVWQRISWTILDINTFVPIAVSLLSVQLLWKHWRTPPTAHLISIRSIDPWRFLIVCTVTVLILALTIPTIYAFCFAYWIAPWS